MKKILVIHTGGTISMHEEDGQILPGDVNPMTHVHLTDHDDIEISSIDLLNLPSPHITPQHMLVIYQELKLKLPYFDGAVITHGTDTLEETAYFLDTLALPDDKPVVLTGAMRSSNELGSDGVYNYRSALRVAADDKAVGKGVLVVMNDEIHAAKYVTKTHTTNVSTFQTPTHGPLGLLTKHDSLYFQTAEARVRFDLSEIKGTIPIIKAYAGMGAGILVLLDSEHIDGLVIEALGAGNLPPDAVPYLTDLIANGTPVILVSRCFNGIAEAVYGYEGGGVALAQAGVMFVKELNSQKARLKLLIALNSGLTGQALKAYIEG